MSPVSESEWLEVYPSNDNWADVQVIEGVSGSVPGTLLGANLEGSGENSLIGRNWLWGYDYSVWYRWIPEVGGTYFFEVNHDPEMDTSLDVTVDSTDATDGIVIAIGENRTNVDTRPRLGVRVQAGTEYYIRVCGDTGAPFQLTWGPTVVQTNCEIDNAFDLRAPGDVRGSLIDGLTEGPLRAMAAEVEEPPDPVPTAWYTYTNRNTQAVLFVADAIPDDPNTNELGMYVYVGDLEEGEFGAYISPANDLRVVLEPAEQIQFAVVDDWYEMGMCDFTLTWQESDVPFKDTSVVLTAYDPTNANLSSSTSKYGIFGIHHDGQIETILSTSTQTPTHPLAAVIGETGNLWYIDQKDRPVSVDYGNSMWRYWEGTTPDGTQSEVDFDDSSWAVGRMPFGPTGYSVGGRSPNTIISTAPSRQLYVRRKIKGPGTLQMWFAFDDDVTMWVDGVMVGGYGGQNTAVYNDLVSFSKVLGEGDHLVAIRLYDYGFGANWLDVKWTVTPTSTSGSASKNYTLHRVLDGVDTNVLAGNYTGDMYPMPSDGTRFTPHISRHDGDPYHIWISYTNRNDGVNLLPVSDGSFETAEVNPWVPAPGTNTILSASSTYAAHGSWAMKMVYSGTGGTAPYTLGAESGFFDINTMTRPANGWYFGFAQFYWTNWTVDAGHEFDTTISIQFLSYNSSFVQVGHSGGGLYSYPAFDNGPPTFWTNTVSGGSFEFSIPASARYVKAQVYANRVPAGAQIYVDKVGLFENPYYSELQVYSNSWRVWSVEQKLENPHQWQVGARDPSPSGAGIGGFKYDTGTIGFPQRQVDEYKLSQTHGGEQFNSYCVTPDDPTLEVYLHHMEFSTSERFLLYKRNTLDDTLTGTLAEYLTSIHNGTSYPWMNTSQTGPGEEVRLHYMNNGNLFFAVQLTNCIYASVAFELTTEGVFVAAYPDTKMAPYSFTSVLRRPRMAGVSSYSCPDPDGLHFWVVDYNSTNAGSPVYKVPYAGSIVQTPISTLAAKYKPTYLVQHRAASVSTCDVEGWWNCSYLYRKQLVIIGPNRGLDDLHPITLLMPKTDISVQGKVRPDLADIEVIRVQGSNFQVIEHVITETADDIIVTFPAMRSLSAGEVVDEYYVYYGNPELESAPSQVAYTPATWPSSLSLTSDVTFTMPGMDWFVSDFQASTNIVGAKAISTFYGKSVQVRADKDMLSGIVEISVDDEAPVLIDLYSSVAEYNIPMFTKTGLTDTAHTIRIVVSTEKNAAATDHRVSLTGVDVFKWANAEAQLEEIIPLRWTSNVGSNH